MGQLGIWVWVSSLPPFSCYSINSEKIFWLEFGFRFTFFYIFVRPVDRILNTSHITMLSFYFSPSDLQSFGDELNISSKTAPANIWAHKNLKQIFGYFKLRFHNELLHWEKNRFLVFFRAGLHLHVRKISKFSVKQFRLFAKISYIFDN